MKKNKCRLHPIEMAARNASFDILGYIQQKFKEALTDIHFIDENTGEPIKHWHKWSGEVPQRRDVVVLHFGEDKENTVCYMVRGRVISDTRPGHISIYIKKL